MPNGTRGRALPTCGDYDEAELIAYGYSRDHRPDRKQLELATTVLIDGGVPLDYRVLTGNVADRTTPVENLRRLQGLLAHNPAERPLVISDLHKEERIRALVFCTMVALLVFALLELLARCAALTQSGTTFLAQFASVSILVLAFQDGSTLRRLSGLAPPLPTILEALGFPPAERYVTGHV